MTKPEKPRGGAGDSLPSAEYTAVGKALSAIAAAIKVPCSLSPTVSALSMHAVRCAPALGAYPRELRRQPASPARHHCRRGVPRARPPALAASPLVLTVWHDEHEYLAPLLSVPRDFLYST